jgi:hypothetical protein
MSSVFRTKNLQDAGIDNDFFLEKSCRKIYTVFSTVQRQQRKSDVMTSFGLFWPAAPSIIRFLIAGSSLSDLAYFWDDFAYIFQKKSNTI